MSDGGEVCEPAIRDSRAVQQLQTDGLALATEPTVATLCEPGLLARMPLARRPGISVQSLITPSNRPLGPRSQALAAEVRRLAKALRQ